MPDILAVMEDPNLFSPHFKGASWQPWKAFLAGLFGLPMTPEQFELFKQFTGRTIAPDKQFREAALICGRRAGKSRICAYIATYLAAFRDYRPYLASGELITIAILASDRRQARNIFRYISGAFRDIALLKPMVVEELTESITLNNSVVIEVGTASLRATRGYTYAAVLADEVSFWRDETSANPAEEILNAIRPGLSSVPNSMLLLASSPYAKKGALFKSYKRNYARDDARTLVFKGSSLELNPSLDPDVIAEAYETDAAAANAEFGGNFRDDVVSYVSAEIIDDCTATGRSELSPISTQKYVAFVDPSGGSSDSYCVAIAHREQRGIGANAISMAVLDYVAEFKPPFSPEDVTNEIASAVLRFGCRSVVGDRYGGEFPRELLRKRGVEYNLSDRTASDYFRDALPIFNSGKAELLDVPRIRQQFLALERRTSRSGKDAIGHPTGGSGNNNYHDDLAVCVAAVTVMASGGLSDIEAATRRFIALSS